LTEHLTIHREWTNDNYYTKRFSFDELKEMQTRLDMDNDEFTEFITGKTDDSYADDACDIMKDMWMSCSQYDDEDKMEGCIDRCMRTEEFQTCYTVFRLWNSHLSPEQAKNEWYSSSLETLAGMLEEM